MTTRTEKKAKQNTSGLLELLNDRASWDLPPYRIPEVDERKLEEAARLHAQACNGDPFAYYRIKLHMRMGYELVSDVHKDALNTLNRRLQRVRGGHDVVEAREAAE